MNDQNYNGDIYSGIDFYKYLNCPDCVENELYCPTHRVEVDKILALKP